MNNLLEKLLTKQSAIIPLCRNSFLLNSRRFNLQVADGWYEIIYDDSGVIDFRQLVPGAAIKLTTKLKRIKGYYWQRSFIFASFAQEKIITGNMAQTHNLYFAIGLQDWDTIEAILWEDGQLYFRRAVNPSIDLVLVRHKLQTGESLQNIPHLSIELRFLYILHQLQQQYLQELAQKQAQAKWLKTLTGRLTNTLQAAGAEYLSHRETGDGNIIVNWRVRGQTFNSLIRADFRVKEAGFCCSGHDQEHTLASAVLLAQNYIDDENYFEVTRR